jgi:uracil-DNA glycosylase family 4
MKIYSIESLKRHIAQCTLCEESLINGVRPVCSFSAKSKVVIIGQAPGIKVHNSGKPWDDKSGENLRNWLGVTEAEFYNTDNFAIIPMGFCYPGKGKSGDLPPRKECAPQWHDEIFQHLTNIKLYVLIGTYAQKHYLKNANNTLTETVKNYKHFLPNYMVLPHPSPRNNIWQSKNPWFKTTLIPELQSLIKSIIS